MPSPVPRCRLVPSWALVLTLGVVVQARAEEAADIARIHLEAIGGPQRIAALQSLRVSGAVMVGEKRMKFTLLAARPDRIRLETESGSRTLVNASDGVTPPWEFDTGTWPPRFRTMDEAAARAFVADAEFDDPLVAGAARGFTLEYAGEVDAGGRKLLRVLVTKKLTDTFSLLLDPITYFIVMRVDERTLASGRKRQIVTRYDDFRPVDGVLLPHRVTLLADNRVQQQMVMEKIETNPELSAEAFSRPQPAAAEQK